MLLSRMRAPLEGTVGALLVPQIRAVEDEYHLVVSCIQRPLRYRRRVVQEDLSREGPESFIYDTVESLDNAAEGGRNETLVWKSKISGHVLDRVSGPQLRQKHVESLILVP